MSPDIEPLVSVIISTYNWSDALRCAVQSARLQTLRNIEILVVGDGCTDDSGAVVAAFGDPRVNWINLERNCGHQFGPNNEGLRQARGEWIAYLGHDDIWYPTHLESTLRVAASKSADLVAGVTIFYGTPGSGLRGMSGLFPNGTFEPPEWAPPPSLVHRRSLVARIGDWKDPKTISLPSDVDFVKRMLDTGIRTACTNELTLFKFNAGRKNTYKLRSNHEQREFLRRVEAGSDFRHLELTDFLRAEQDGLSFPLRMPSESERAAPGDEYRRTRRLKGILPRFSSELLRSLEKRERFFMVRHGLMEWHRLQLHPIFGRFRWTGPGRRSTVECPVRLDRPITIRIHVLRAMRDDLLPPRLFSGETPLAVAVEATRFGTFMLQTRLTPETGGDDFVSFAIELDGTVRPNDVGQGRDRRPLGLAVNWVEFEPDQSERTGTAT